VLGIAVTGYRTRVQQIEARNRMLEAEVARRTAELREKRDELEEALHHLKTTQEQLIHQEKLASLGQLTAGIAHEIKNPLNFVNNFAELNAELAQELIEELETHRPDLPDGVVQAFEAVLSDLSLNAEKIREQGRRADGIVRSMMLHARGTPGERRRTDLNTLVKEYVNLAWHGAQANPSGSDVRIEQVYDDAVGEVELVPQEVGRVLLNLLANASYAVQEKGRSTDGGYEPVVRVSTQRRAERVEIRVADNGPGIPRHLTQKIFEPFFTTKPAGSGTGLGLSLAHDIVVQGHGGTLTVESRDGEGAAFVVTLPHPPAHSAAPSAV
jgi:signal transduction histidine kinase